MHLSHIHEIKQCLRVPNSLSTVMKRNMVDLQGDATNLAWSIPAHKIDAKAWRPRTTLKRTSSQVPSIPEEDAFSEAELRKLEAHLPPHKSCSLTEPFAEDSPQGEVGL